MQLKGVLKNYFQALQGFGVDRHLLGLKMIALENNIPLPDIYYDVAYKRSTHFRISTSQVNQTHCILVLYLCSR